MVNNAIIHNFFITYKKITSFAHHTGLSKTDKYNFLMNRKSDEKFVLTPAN